MLIDTHCHLNLSAFTQDLAEVVIKARQAGVKKMIVAGVDLTSSQRAVELANEYEEIYAAVGYHPHHVQKWVGLDEIEIEQELVMIITGLKQLIDKGKKIVAVGEIGLDYYQYHQTKYADSQITPEIKTSQKKLLIAQLELAIRAKLPVILHTRQSTKETMKIVKQQQNKLVGGVWHCFGGDLAQAKKIVNNWMGFYIGIDGNVTYHNRKFDKLKQIASWVPSERLVIETDAPYLTPEPKRGQRCEPADVKLIAEYLSKLRGESYAHLVDRTGDNGLRLFARMR